MKRSISNILVVSMIFLFILHWSDAASLRASFNGPITDEATTSEPILSRRRPVLPSNERRRRWMKFSADDDEVEILPELSMKNHFEETSQENDRSLFLDGTQTSTIVNNNNNDSISTVPFDYETTVESELNSLSTQSSELESGNTAVPIVNLNDSNVSTHVDGIETERKLPVELTTLPVEYNLTHVEDMSSSTPDSVDTTSLDAINKHDVSYSEITEELLSTKMFDSVPMDTTKTPITISTEETTDRPLISNVTNDEENISVDDRTEIPLSMDITKTDTTNLIEETTEKLSLHNITEADDIVSTKDVTESQVSNNTTDSDNNISTENVTEPQISYNITDSDYSSSVDETTGISLSNGTVADDPVTIFVTSEAPTSTNVTTVEDLVTDEITDTDSTYDVDTIEMNTSTWSLITNNETMDDDNSSNPFIISNDVQPQPICDFECQCRKKCWYGFKFIDDQCQCDPPCAEYKCFFDDVCKVMENGKRLCESVNGTEYERPTRCYQPADPGFHDENMQYHDRWYYNPEQNTCHSFIYRGLGGNENNFMSLNDCNIECITCGSSPSRGTCQGTMPMWYYDHRANECSQFEYSGCQGNYNQFFEKQECIDTCVTRILHL